MDVPEHLEKQLQELDKLFLTLSTKEEKRAALHAFGTREAEIQGFGSVQWVSESPNNLVPPAYKKNKEKNDAAVAAFMDVIDEQSTACLYKDMKDAPSLSRLPCAYQN
ncbi:hypothetical protein MPER_10602, partial [Moniliophthora perniciosa FA553]